MKKWTPEFLVGDDVTARVRFGRHAGRKVKGVITNLDCGTGDTLLTAVIHTADDKFVRVRPESLRYRTGKGGFASKLNADGSITFYRNDAKMLDPDWWIRHPRRKGALTENGAGLLHYYITHNGYSRQKLRKPRAR